MLAYMVTCFISVGSFLPMVSFPGRGGYGPQDGAVFGFSIALLPMGPILGILESKGHRSKQETRA